MFGFHNNFKINSELQLSLAYYYVLPVSDIEESFSEELYISSKISNHLLSFGFIIGL